MINKNSCSTTSLILLLLLLTAKVAKTNLFEGNCGKPTIEPIFKSKNEANRIINGSEATAHSLPWMVLIETKAGDSFKECAGFLIENGETNQTDLVMSAAHCFIKDRNFLPTSNVTVVIGAHQIEVQEPLLTALVLTYVTPFYNFKEIENDIAILKLDKKIAYSYKTMPICLPEKQTTVELPKMDMCFAAGWGMDESGQESSVLKVTQQIPKKVPCQKSIYKKNIIFTEGLNLSSRPWKGDSGSPLACKINGKFVALGICSFVSTDCPTEEPNSYYARIDAYVDWITDKIKELGSAEKDSAQGLKLNDFFSTKIGPLYYRPPKAKPIEIVAHNAGFKRRDN